MIFDIPAWWVALSALILSIAILTTRQHINIRVFALASLLQFALYVAFWVWELPIETRQFIGRSNIIVMNIMLIIIIFGAKNDANNG